eukprot:2154635-Pleurochrysis_carterae.AAC.2
MELLSRIRSEISRRRCEVRILRNCLQEVQQDHAKAKRTLDIKRLKGVEPKDEALEALVALLAAEEQDVKHVTRSFERKILLAAQKYSTFDLRLTELSSDSAPPMRRFPSTD